MSAGGAGADQSAFKSKDARGGISGLLGANGEIPVIGVSVAADNGSLTEVTVGAVTAAVVMVEGVVMVRGVASGGSSSM